MVRQTAASGPVDGRLQTGAGVPDVRHRRLAGLGAVATGGADGAAIGLLGLVGLAFGAWLIGSMRPTVRWWAAAALAAAVLAWPAGEPRRRSDIGVHGSNRQVGAAQWQSLGPGTGGQTQRRRQTGVRRFHGGVVRQLSGQQAVGAPHRIEQAFAAKKVTLMRADWTNRDERITGGADCDGPARACRCMCCARKPRSSCRNC